MTSRSATIAALPPKSADLMPGPSRGRLEEAVALNAKCVSCHSQQAKEWLGSYHQRANTEPAFRRAFAIEPSPFCRRCHAPESAPASEPSEAVSELGVGCVTCHVVEEGIVLAAARADGDSPDSAPHAIRRSIRFAHTGACAACHEFRFPGPPGNDDAYFMQTTVREHQRSPAASRACADCHMPKTNGSRSHTFAQVRDREFLRANLTATAERTPEDTLRITLVQTDPGHAFPTGDLFRRLEVGYEVTEAGGNVLTRETRYLARHFVIVPGKAGRQLAQDDRVLGKSSVVEMALPSLPPAPVPARVSWWVTFQRVASVGEGTEPSDAIVESEVRLHAGELPW